MILFFDFLQALKKIRGHFAWDRRRKQWDKTSHHGSPKSTFPPIQHPTAHDSTVTKIKNMQNIRVPCLNTKLHARNQQSASPQHPPDGKHNHGIVSTNNGLPFPTNEHLDQIFELRMGGDLLWPFVYKPKLSY